jgi:hypothetical protein
MDQEFGPLVWIVDEKRRLISLDLAEPNDAKMRKSFVRSDLLFGSESEVNPPRGSFLFLGGVR